MFNVVLVRPEIPPNTGNIGRLCLATQSMLHLVKPLGFSLNDRQLKRAGLDYWDEVNLKLWDSLDALRRSQPPDANYFFLTTKSKRPYYDARFQPDDFLVFGPETKGLPENLLAVSASQCMEPAA
jgi:tRNA (cytidine/uridine-2'-O-)-methyltransferase